MTRPGPGEAELRDLVGAITEGRPLTDEAPELVLLATAV